MQDRIRAIANALNLQTIIWEYDSLDWMDGIDGYTVADVDANYQLFINNETAGTFSTAGGIMLTHELNNFTMSEAIKWYPQLRASFPVRYLLPRLIIGMSEAILIFILVHSPHWGRSQQDPAVSGDQLFIADVSAVYVVAHLVCICYKTHSSCRQISQARSQSPETTRVRNRPNERPYYVVVRGT